MKTNWIGGSLLSGCVAAIIGFFILAALINNDPIIADGKENITAASNMIHHRVFSISTDSLPHPDMKREPAWPALTAGMLVMAGLDGQDVGILATQHQTFFKKINVVAISLVIGFATALAWRYSRRPLLGCLLAFIVGIAVFATTPRLINYFNNEPLATLLLLAASALTVSSLKGTWRTAVVLGVTLGLLALTKAQFLYIGLVAIAPLAFRSRKHALLATVAFALVVLPWIFRNYGLFREPAISERGKTVLAIRLVMVAEHQQDEQACMVVAFSHPKWRDSIAKLVGVGPEDFGRGARCQRFNREIAFDMGLEKVSCTSFPEDNQAMKSGNWRTATQYFYRGMSAGREIEAGRLKLSDVEPLSWENLRRYLETLPLFAWRGIGFTAYPALSIILSLSVFMLIFTRLWAFSLLAVSSHLFHLLVTHNIPRYHAVEMGAMILAVAYVLDAALYFAPLVVSRAALRADRAGT